MSYVRVVHWLNLVKICWTEYLNFHLFSLFNYDKYFLGGKKVWQNAVPP